MRPLVPWGSGQAPPAVAWVPHAFSLCGLTCGFLSLLASSTHDFAFAAAFIIAAIFFDGFDGAAARALRCDGPFGEVMDSLADLVVFGVAPAFLAYQANLHLFGTAGAFAGAIFAGCGAIRLARFPLVKAQGYFVGLPIPMAGAFLAMLGVYASELPPVAVPVATVSVALLMVTTIHFPKFGTALGMFPPPARWALCLAMAPVLFVFAPKTILFLLALYLFLGPASELRLVFDRDHR
ncbi:MAG: CDP-diacylglycerol--serine O-phosphatidyltransferase [Chloroflexi bacterium]|nr:CDP-diacylglycerol--serine O-phosphatidyltransferase [Chloroflexota bacterium]